MAPDSERTQNAEPKAKIFISYSRKDMAFADRLDAALKARGFEPLIDRTEIYAFEDWSKRLQALIGHADTVVFVLSPDSIASHEALKEVEYASLLKKRIAPIVCRRVEDGAVPEPLRRLNYIFFDDPAHFDDSFDKLCEALQTAIEWIRKNTEFGEAARHWSAAGRPGGLLLRSPDLEKAEKWIAERPHNAPQPTAETKTFIAESRRGATRRRNVLTGGLAIGLIAALALAGVALRQAGVARTEKSLANANEQLAVTDEKRAVAGEQRAVTAERKAVAEEQQVITEDMNRRAALAQQLASSGKTQQATAVALDTLQNGAEDRSPTRELEAAIHRTLNLMKVPVEHYLGENVFNMALSPDGGTLAAGTVKGMVYLLDAATLAQRFELNTGSDVISGLDFSPNGKLLVATGDKIPNVWNVETGKKIVDLQRPDAQRSAYGAHFSPDGKLIVVATGENRALVHDAATGKLLYVLSGATYEEMRDSLRTQSKDGFGVADPIIDVVNRATFQIWGAATDAIFSPDGHIIAVTGPSNPDGSVRLFDAANGQLLRTLTGGHGAAFLPPKGYGRTLAFSPDGSRLIAAPLGVTIKSWNVQDGQLQSEISIRGISTFLLTTDGRAVVSAQDNGVMIFRCLDQVSGVVSVQAHESSIDTLSVDREGLLLATGSTDRTARLWRMPQGSDLCDADQPGNTAFDALSVLRPAAILAPHGARITAVAFAKDDRSVTTASQDGWVRMWPIGLNADSISIVLPPTSSSFGGWERMLQSSDNRTIFAFDSGDLRWAGWDGATGQPLDIPDNVEAVAPGAKDRPAILFTSPTSHVELGASPGPQDNTLISGSAWREPVSPDGSRVVVGESWLKDQSDFNINEVSVLIDSGTKQVLARLVADGRAAQDLFFSPDGSRLFGRLPHSGPPNDNPGAGIAAWDAHTGALIAMVPAIPDFPATMKGVASRDGKRLLIGQSILFDVAKDGFTPVDAPETGTDAFSGRSATAATLSADGAYLIVGRSDGTIMVADIDRKVLWRVFDTQGLKISAVAISDDKSYVAAADSSNTVWIFLGELGEPVRSETFPANVTSLLFLHGPDRLAALNFRNLTIMPLLPAFAGRSDTAAIVDAARKLGLNLVSEEDRRHYQIGASAPPDQPADHKWAAIDPNSEGTAPVVWADSRDVARKNAIAACQGRSTTCAPTPAMTTNPEATFIYYCCIHPRLGCAVASDVGDAALLTVKAILAKANYSSCEVRAALSARDGSRR